MLGIARPEVRREHVVGGETVDHRRDGLGGVVVQLRLAVGPDRTLEGDPRRPGQPVRVPSAGTLAVGRPEPREEAVLDQARQASLGDASVAVHEQGRELGCHDVAVHQPQQEAPVTLGQRRPGRDPGRPPDAGASGRGQGGPPSGKRASARSCALRSGGIRGVDDVAGGHGSGSLQCGTGDLGSAWTASVRTTNASPVEIARSRWQPRRTAPGAAENELITPGPTVRTRRPLGQRQMGT